MLKFSGWERSRIKTDRVFADISNKAERYYDKNIQKSMSILLSVSVILGVFTILPMSASAHMILLKAASAAQTVYCVFSIQKEG